MTKIEDWFFKSRPEGSIQFPIKNRAEGRWLAFVLAEIGVWLIKAVKILTECLKCFKAICKDCKITFFHHYFLLLIFVF